MTAFDDLIHLKVTFDSKISDVIACIQASGSVACALLYDNQNTFVNIITDGDVRRAFLEGRKLDDSAREIQVIKERSTRPKPITANARANNDEREALFREYSLRQLVLTDDNGRPVSVIDHNAVNHSPSFIDHKFTAVVMAGGFGTRLRPLTVDTPKPMLQVNGRPMLEISIEKLVAHGASRIIITTHYLPEKITEHFGNGERFGVEIEYVHEETPLGTGGALSLVPFRDENTLVFNGDILTNLDIGMFLAFHLRSRSAMTIAATQYSFQVPFGVITERDSLVTNIEEKPNFSFLVNSGIYFLSKSVFETLPDSGAYNMTDVANNLIAAKQPVSCFPIFEHWLDVGRPSDYDLASKLF
ncbi:nucleotidyltransferase family protein [Caballeronia sp. GAWG1-5s-s]|uniref:nucleotidyltransferase family protein n=1 Tax=Caballeronia sp. GAWG1-5s-s TaxID=2921743 RepID=UPI002027A51F|nr:nucleotidyltransferase family protein [Caballeronia sp. GAWG1-5s-s]